MSDEKSMYPLSWPDTWPRTPKHQRSKPQFHEKTVADAVDFLLAEINRLNGRWWGAANNVIVSTNLRPTLAGRPASNAAEPDDCGVAVYFKLKDKPVTLACDKWKKVSWNIYAIAKDIEAQRARVRWGVGTLDQAFRGYMALPGIGQSSGIQWWTVLGVSINATEAQVREAYRILAKKHHPDKGGNRELWERISTAMQLFDSQIRGKLTPV